MAETLVKDFEVCKTILDWLQTSGYEVTEAAQITPEVYNSWMASHGYSAIVNDAGEIVTWVKGTNIVDAAASYSAQTTGTALTTVSSTSTQVAVETVTGDVVSSTGELIAENVATTAFTDTTVSELGLSTTAAGTAVGDTAAGITLTPKTVVVAAVIGAIGFEASMVATQAIVNAMTGGDQPINWNPFSVMGEIITYFTEDGKTYIDEELINELYQWLYSNGYLASFSEHTGTWYNETVPTTSLKSLGNVAVNKLTDEAPTWLKNSSSYINVLRRISEFINSSTTFANLDTFAGIGTLYLSISTGYWTPSSFTYHWIFKRFDTNEVISGAISDEGGSVTIGASDGWEYSYPAYLATITNDPISTSGTTLTEQTPTFMENEPSSLPSDTTIASITLLNIGLISDYVLNHQIGANVADGTSLPDLYPDWYNNQMYRDNTGGNPQNEEDERTGLLPLWLPSSDENPDPTKTPQEQAQDGTNTDEDMDDRIDGMTGFPIIPDSTIPTDDIGETTPVVVPTSGSGTGMVKIYNPTLASLASFSQWLWSANIFDNFSKLFQDPMQAIIGLNLLYATPSRGSDDNIIVGNLDSNVNSRTVNNQYITIDCGTITIGKYFNNALDYINTQVECYLPFVGIVRFNGADVVGKPINIKCTVDVLTGTCLYNVFVGGQLLYTYNGNCAVQLPLSSSNYSSIITGGIALAGGVAATIASGGAAAPAVIGAVSAAAGIANHQIERSGSLGANAGAMGKKKPYLIITRNKPFNPTNYNKFYGYPANSTVQSLGNLSGYTQVKDIRISGINATQAEKIEIESLLKGGIIL